MKEYKNMLDISAPFDYTTKKIDALKVSGQIGFFTSVKYFPWSVSIGLSKDSAD